MNAYTSNVILLATMVPFTSGIGCGSGKDGGMRGNEATQEHAPESPAAQVQQGRLIMVALDSLHPAYLHLDRDGYRAGSEGNWLMPNVREFLEMSTWFPDAKCHLPSATDMNHLNALAGTSSAQTGLIGVSGQMVGWGSDGEALVMATDLEFLKDDQGRNVDTLFHAFKRQNPDATTAFVAGKGWVAEMFRSQNVVDHIITGASFPDYQEGPQKHNFFDPSGDRDARCDPESMQQRLLGSVFSAAPELFPSDAWVVDATLNLFDREDPAMSYVLLAQMDDGGHAFGAAWDPSEFVERVRRIRVPKCSYEPLTNYVDTRNVGLYRAPILDLARDVDHQFGRLMEGLEKRGALEDATVVLLSDHSMITHLSDRVLFPQQTDYRDTLKNANLVGTDDFFAYGGSSLALLYWREGKYRVPAAKELLKAYQAANPQTGEMGHPWWVLDRNDMKNGVAGVVRAGELYHTYFIEEDDENSMVWPDLMLFAREGWQLPAYEGLYNVGMGVPVPVPTLNPFSGGHGSVDTRPIMMAFSLPQSRKAAVRMHEVYISDIAVTISELFDLPLQSSTIGTDLTDDIALTDNDIAR